MKDKSKSLDFLDYLEFRTGCNEDKALDRLIEIENLGEKFINLGDERRIGAVNRNLVLALIACYCLGYNEALKEIGLKDEQL